MKRPEWKSAIVCCKDCVERSPGCHGRCKRYAAEKAKHDAEREAKHAADAAAWDYGRYRRSLSERAKKNLR